MHNVRVLVAAAGSGTRAGLPYPKTLHPVLGKPILVRLLELLNTVDNRPVVVVSPSGFQHVETTLAEHELSADIVIQREPTGMGDAVLCFRQAPLAEDAEHVLLVWGDIPLIQAETVAALLHAHSANNNDFTLVTRRVERAYTIVDRDEQGQVRAVVETRERGLEPIEGERDIGLFLFRATPVLEALVQRLPGALGSRTGEHGFLYVVAHLVAAGARVEALPVATELDLISLNSLSDLAPIERLDAIPEDSAR